MKMVQPKGGEFMRYQWRVTKYNPDYRDEKGNYQKTNEWTSYSDIGKTVTKEEYETVANAYVNSVISLMNKLEVKHLRVTNLEGESPLKEGQIIYISDLNTVIQAVLRDEYWCKLESNDIFVHFGFDFYMYLGSNDDSSEALHEIKLSGLYVELYESPYLFPS